MKDPRKIETMAKITLENLHFYFVYFPQNKDS